MSQKLPSLSALRAFEVAARHMSFRKAAEALNVTHSAISHQVKILEEQLGVALFLRTARGVELTIEGHFLFPILKSSFGQISDGIKYLTSTGEPNSLSIQVYITAATRWLIPRLPSFQKQEPNLSARLITSYLDWEFDRQNVDVAILLVKKQEIDLHYVDLFPATLIPVCSPMLLKSGRPLVAPKDIIHHQLLRVFTSPDDWKIWILAAGINGIVATNGSANGLSFDSYIMALEAAAEGQGIAMLNGPFAARELQSGKLIQPFDVKVDNPRKWCLVYRKEHRGDRRIKRFQEWLLGQIDAENV